MTDDRGNTISRREFLRGAVAAGAATWGLPNLVRSDDVLADGHRPLVVRIRSDNVVSSRGVHEGIAEAMLESLLQRITGEPDASDAWAKLIRPDDIVGLKFNRSGALELGTSDPMLRVLVRSLRRAGFPADQIVALEGTTSLCTRLGLQIPATGWNTEEVDFGSGKDQLAAWLDQVTAIINIPFLKNHNIAGITCCLKNLSHAVVKHPAQFHANGCSPYIGDIVALPAIRSKLRLHLVNGLRCVFDHGPDADEDFIWDGGFLMAGLDPVAVDRVAADLLDEVRLRLSLPPVAPDGEPPAYITAASKRGLGEAKLYKIDFERTKF